MISKPAGYANHTRKKPEAVAVEFNPEHGIKKTRKDTRSLYSSKKLICDAGRDKKPLAHYMQGKRGRGGMEGSEGREDGCLPLCASNCSYLRNTDENW
jgi:hypothetical protein